MSEQPPAGGAAEPTELAPATPEFAPMWGPEPEALGVEVEPTGHPGVDAALGLLGRLDGVPTTEHAAVYENVQQSLSTILGSLDDSLTAP
ncbi:hypothetical protein [Kitasatospora sp. LaBMicrA B282]|uniref:hypothetical protein n=1 Tax=Kitasatospora sp. LaBMicrA B282 TaxID=3420949 RepID=UPI003D1369BA